MSSDWAVLALVLLMFAAGFVGGWSWRRLIREARELWKEMRSG